MRFLWVALWSAVIFATLPFAPDVVTFFSRTINRLFATDRGYQAQGWVAAAAVAAVLALLIVRFLRSPAGRSWPRRAVVVAVVGVYGYLLATLEVPPEKIHFLEYGVLAWLLRRAFDPIAGPAVRPASFFAGVAIGAADEFIQHLLPNRVGQIDDVALNAAAVGLPLVLGAATSPCHRGPAGPRDLRAVRAMGLAAVAAVGAFAACVPEFGIEIDDPRGVRFKTRLASPEALLAADAAVPPAALERLRVETDSTYAAYLRDHPSATEPFLHQFRVHLFRRDRYLGQGDLRIAWNENRILEAWFPATLGAIGARWDDDTHARVHARLAEAPAVGGYASPVGKDIVTRHGPVSILLIALAAGAVVAVAPGVFLRPRPAAAVAAVFIAATAAPAVVHRPVRPSLEAIRATTPAVAVPLGGPAVEVAIGRNADGAADGTTRATIAADPGGLRVAFLSTDTEIVATLRGRDAPLWTEDAVEVFIDTEGAGSRYVEIEVSPAGEVHDALVVFGRPVVFDTAWTAPGLAVETAAVALAWRAEIRIPWRDLGLARPPPALRANLYRIDADARAGPRTYLAWSPTRDWFHRPWRFGFVFPEGG